MYNLRVHAIGESDGRRERRASNPGQLGYDVAMHKLCCPHARRIVSGSRSQSEQMAELQLWQSLDAELLNLYDNFSNLVRAAHIPDEDSEHAAFTKEKKAPGDLLEVWAEKLAYSGFTALHILSQLKRGALLGDFNALVNNVRAVRTAFDRSEDAANMQLAGMKQEVQELLGQLELSYYSSQYRGRLVTASTSQELKDLCQLALEAGDRPA